MSADEYLMELALSDEMISPHEIRVALSEFKQRLAQEVREDFPDLNPLASIFKPYLGEEIAQFIERY